MCAPPMNELAARCSISSAARCTTSIQLLRGFSTCSRGGSSDAEIADAIQAEFKVERLVMEQHVQDFLENLKKQGMIDAC
jgi:Coenzyme PQQ synthesis protein D (PqqD)